MQKERNMEINEESWKNQFGSMELKNRNDDERGLFIPMIKNETPEDRAIRILAMMEESNNRLNRMLEIFNRIDH